MELIDTHCHLTFEELIGDVEAVIERSKNAGVTGWITVGTDTDQNHKVVELVDRFENMYAAVGIHPHYAKDVNAGDITELRKLAQNEKVVAIGETGLDLHYDFSCYEDQRRLFAKHLQIATESNLPVIVHSREAFDETMDVLQRFGRDIKKVVLHCFSYSAKHAKIALEHGFYISFTGVVTFKDGRAACEAAEVVPPDRLMIETDCPYMSPEPMRKRKVNEPALMIHIAGRLAELKGIDLAGFAETATATSRRFFTLPLK